jgi:hypothetical protein
MIAPWPSTPEIILTLSTNSRPPSPKVQPPRCGQISVDGLLLIELPRRLPNPLTTNLCCGRHVDGGIELEGSDRAITQIELVDAAPKLFVDRFQPAALNEFDTAALNFWRGRQIVATKAIDGQCGRIVAQQRRNQNRSRAENDS